MLEVCFGDSTPMVISMVYVQRYSRPVIVYFSPLQALI